MSQPANAKAAVGFIGIGSMGWPMASRLREAGLEVVALDADAKRLKEFADKTGARAAADGADLAAQADVIVTILPTSAIVEQVLSGPQGVLAKLRPGALIVEMSSGVPAETQRLAKLVQDAGGHLIDAPVSGGVPRAVTGELAIMVGGEDALVERARPVLSHMGKTITHTGAVGTAHAMKALNNLVSAGGFLIGIEAMLIGQRFGLEPEVMVDVFNSSTGMNNSTQKKFKQFVLSRRFDSGFGLDLMVKDLRIALGIAENGAVPAPFATLCRELWASAGKLLGPGQDHTAVARLSETLAASELKPGAGK